jgi:hypothetical protein
MFASVSAGINALFGPLHGGANEAVLNMLRDIQAKGMQPEDFMEKVKNKEDGVKLMGFGHRVYKNYDPRAKIVKATAHDILSKLGGNDELLDIAMRLEEKALATITSSSASSTRTWTSTRPDLQGDGLPEKMFTVLFAIGRLPGWIAQWREMMQDPQTKIGRPASSTRARSSATTRPGRAGCGRRRSPPQGSALTVLPAQQHGKRRRPLSSESGRRLRLIPDRRLLAGGVALGVVFLPAPVVFAHLVERAHRGPAKVGQGRGGVGVAHRCVSGPAGRELVGNLLAGRLGERGKDLKDR